MHMVHMSACRECLPSLSRIVDCSALLRDCPCAGHLLKGVLPSAGLIDLLGLRWDLPEGTEKVIPQVFLCRAKAPDAKGNVLQYTLSGLYV